MAVSGVQCAVRIAKNRASPRAAVLPWSSGQLVFCRSAKGARSQNRVANVVAVLHSVREVAIEQPGAFAAGRAVKRRAQVRHGFGEGSIFVAVGFDAGGPLLDAPRGAVFPRFYFRGDPSSFPP